MKNLNHKTDLIRKGGVFTGAAMALVTAAVMAMAPTSQAFAYQKVQVTAEHRSGWYRLKFTGHGNTAKKAKEDVAKNVSCNVLGRKGSKKKGYHWKSTKSMYSGTWFNAFYTLECVGKPNQVRMGLGGGPLICPLMFNSWRFSVR